MLPSSSAPSPAGEALIVLFPLGYLTFLPTGYSGPTLPLSLTHPLFQGCSWAAPAPSCTGLPASLSLCTSGAPGNPPWWNVWPKSSSSSSWKPLSLWCHTALPAAAAALEQCSSALQKGIKERAPPSRNSERSLHRKNDSAACSSPPLPHKVWLSTGVHVYLCKKFHRHFMEISHHEDTKKAPLRYYKGCKDDFKASRA